ncbi:MAG: glycosyltransferase [Anaerolineae bacterium]|nr:glycosyltransferase [Anaerolineae bacterium]
MRILFAAPLHHPEALRQARDLAAVTGLPTPLFPPSMSQHFWEKALRKRGHELAVFWRNLPHGRAGHAGGHTERHSERLTPGKVIGAVRNRIPLEFNPEARARNRDLIAAARAFRPDVLWMTGDNTIILPDTLAQIRRETGAKLIYASGTSPIVFSKAIDRRAMPLYDWVLVNDYYHGIQWRELGARNMTCLPLSACDPEFHKPYPLTDAQRQELACDVTFVGTLVPGHLYNRRVRALEALSNAGIELGIWSVHDVPSSLRKHLRGPALGEDMERIVSAGKISVNPHGDFMLYGGNLRLFEAAGAGVFQISDDLPGTREWFPDVNGVPTIALYNTEVELVERVRNYLAHDAEREAAAEAARAHAYAHHTYDHRAARFEEGLAEL